MKFDDKIFSTLTDEQKRLVEEAKTPDDLQKIAKEAGYDPAAFSRQIRRMDLMDHGGKSLGISGEDA